MQTSRLVNLSACVYLLWGSELTIAEPSWEIILQELFCGMEKHNFSSTRLWLWNDQDFAEQGGRNGFFQHALAETEMVSRLISEI